MKYIYVIEAKGFAICKIGVANDVQKRLASIQTSSPFTLHVFFSLEVSEQQAFLIEKTAHKLLQGQNMRGEWFDVSADDAKKAVIEAKANPIVKPISKHGAPPKSKLQGYLRTLGKSNRELFANNVGVSVMYLYQIASGFRKASADVCVLIEKHSSGQVTRIDLRPEWFGPIDEAERVAA